MFPILSALIFTPLLGAFLILCLPKDKGGVIKAVALLSTILVLLLSICLLTRFDFTTPQMQFVENVVWIAGGLSKGVNYDALVREQAKPWLAHPEAENRAGALVALCEAARFERARLPDLLELLAFRKHEQDPVRLAFLCALAALPPGRWGAPPDHPKKCSSVTQYPRPYLKKEVDRVSGPSLLVPQASSTLRASPALKTTPSGSASTSANSQVSPPTVTNKPKPGDALRANPRPSPPGAAAINGGGVLQAQPARCPPSCPMPAAAINGGGVLQAQPAPRPTRHICDAARDARARNSPAAPNLEAQCRALGGKP